MEFVARHRYAPMSARKVRLVVDMIRGTHVNDALQILRATPKRASFFVDSILRSAMANADQSLEADMDNLRVSRAWVDKAPDKGPRHRKWWARARGRAVMITSRSCHIHIVLNDGR